jgi:predicted phosphoribosyltransferase
MVLTHQYRKFSHLTDEEIQRQLDQMAKLGVLDDPKLREGKA